MYRYIMLTSYGRRLKSNSRNDTQSNSRNDTRRTDGRTEKRGGTVLGPLPRTIRKDTIYIFMYINRHLCMCV